MHILATGQGHHWFKSYLLSPRNYMNSAGPMAIGSLGTNSREIGIKIKHKSWIMRRCIHENYLSVLLMMSSLYNDVIKWKLIPRYWSFVRAIHRSPMNSPHNGTVMWISMFLWCGSHNCETNSQFTGHRWICAGNSPVTDEFPSQRDSDVDFNVSLMWVP